MHVGALVLCWDVLPPVDAFGGEAVGRLFLPNKIAALQCLWSVGQQVMDLDWKEDLASCFGKIF